MTERVQALPGYVALDALAVLDGTRRGASVQLDAAYFEGQEAALDRVETSALDRRRRVVRESRALYDDVSIDVDSITGANLREASERFRRLLRQLPEVGYFERSFPGRCFVVPEWLRASGELQYGARVYFFPDDGGPTPDAVLRENVAAVVADDRAAFERYQGRLLGYPDCCIEFFQERPANAPPPECRSVEQLAAHVDEAALTGEATAATPIAELLPDVFESPNAYAFFTREFFPEPDCPAARKRGVEIYDALVDAVPEAAVRDYFRLNVGWSYLVAVAVREGGKRRPSPEALGRAHHRFSLPLGVALASSRYR